MRIIIGAGDQRYEGWVATGRAQLDLTNPSSFPPDGSVEAFLSEHVWEHLSLDQARVAARHCYRALRPGGYIRVAVPDANFPDPEYQSMVQVGGPGLADHPAADHQVLYDHALLSDVFTDAGFTVDLLEYCDAAGRFHYNQWDPAEGPIYRSLLNDHRNKGGRIGFASLIIDARKEPGA